MLVVPGSVWALAGGWGLVVIMNGCLIGLSPAIFIDRGHDHNHCRDSIDISTQNVMSKIMGDPHTSRVQFSFQRRILLQVKSWRCRY